MSETATESAPAKVERDYDPKAVRTWATTKAGKKALDKLGITEVKAAGRLNAKVVTAFREDAQRKQDRAAARDVPTPAAE